MKAIDAKNKTEQNRKEAFENDCELMADLSSIITLIEKAVDQGLNFTTYVAIYVSDIIIQHLKVDLGYSVAIDDNYIWGKVYVFISWY